MDASWVLSQSQLLTRRKVRLSDVMDHFVSCIKFLAYLVFFQDPHRNYCWWFRNPAITSWYGKYPIIYRVSYIPGPGGAGFLPSTVSGTRRRAPKAPPLSVTQWFANDIIRTRVGDDDDDDDGGDDGVMVIMVIMVMVMALTKRIGNSVSLPICARYWCSCVHSLQLQKGWLIATKHGCTLKIFKKTSQPLFTNMAALKGDVNLWFHARLKNWYLSYATENPESCLICGKVCSTFMGIQ